MAQPTDINAYREKQQAKSGALLGAYAPLEVSGNAALAAAPLEAPSPTPTGVPNEEGLAMAPGGKVAESLQQSPAANDAHTKKGEHFVTKGEKRFDWQTYMGLGYFVNAAISVGAVLWAERTKSGHKALAKTGELLSKVFSVNPERASALAKKTLFLTGGFAVLAPMKWMEDGKAERVKALNRQIYGEAADQDPKILQSEKELEEAPKQSWKSLVSSRTLALVPFYILMGLLWDNKSAINRMTNKNFKGLGKDAVNALEKNHLDKFQKQAGEGLFVERPITFLSRKLGKIWGSITGNKEAVAITTKLEKQKPGMLYTNLENTKIADTAATALFHVTLAEAVTSYIVAKSVYYLSRVLGPFFGEAEKAAAPRAKNLSIGLGGDDRYIGPESGAFNPQPPVLLQTGEAPPSKLANVTRESLGAVSFAEKQLG